MRLFCWRLCLLLAVLCALPAAPSAPSAEPDEDEDQDSKEDREDMEEEEAESEPRKRSLDPDEPPAGLAKVPPRPLECYICSYKTETPLRSCLDPLKYRSHVAVCRALDESCYTTVEVSDFQTESVVRGCRAACVSTANMRCCNEDRCNAVPFVARDPQPASDVKYSPVSGSKREKSLPPTVLFFVTILLLLQTVAKVSFA